MKLSQIQPNIFALLGADPVLSKAVIIADDGTWPKQPERENGLKTKGLVVTVKKPKNAGNYASESAGSFGADFAVHVFVEQNEEAAMRGQEGIQVSVEDAAERVAIAVLGQPIGTHAQAAQRTEVFRSEEPGIQLFDPENGVNAAMVPILCRYDFVPGDQ